MGINVFPQPSSSYTAGTTFGNTAARPASPVIGQTFYNGTTGAFEVWNGTAWIAINSTPSSVLSVVATNTPSGRAFDNGASSVAFVPSTVGGQATLFTVTTTPASLTTSGTSSPIVVTGLASNTSYTYSVVASNTIAAATATTSGAIVTTTAPATMAAPTAERKRA